MQESKRVPLKVQMDPDMHRALKALAVRQNCHLKDLFESALSDLLKRRKEGVSIRYQASPTRAPEINVLLQPRTLKRVRDAAKADRTPMRRVIYTALSEHVEARA